MLRRSGAVTGVCAAPARWLSPTFSSFESVPSFATLCLPRICDQRRLFANRIVSFTTRRCVSLCIIDRRFIICATLSPPFPSSDALDS